MSIDYAYEKFFVAIHGAISSDDSLQNRLADAYMSSIMRVEITDVSAELGKRIKALGDAVTREPAKDNEGTIKATAAIMSTEEAKKWLEEIVSIFSDICEELYRIRNQPKSRKTKTANIKGKKGSLQIS